MLDNLFKQGMQAGFKVACLEEIAYQKGWLSKESLLKQANSLKQTNYGDYLYKVLRGFMKIIETTLKDCLIIEPVDR